MNEDYTTNEKTVWYTWKGDWTTNSSDYSSRLYKPTGSSKSWYIWSTATDENSKKIQPKKNRRGRHDETLPVQIIPDEVPVPSTADADKNFQEVQPKKNRRGRPKKKIEPLPVEITSQDSTFRPEAIAAGTSAINEGLEKTSV